MATSKAKMPIGSAPWLIQERRQADELVDMETEEFGYSVRNEMEWLNEHMGEIFHNDNLNVADMFKTPGKLRGKTPRTARKRNALGERAPLTDIFASNIQKGASPTKTVFYKQVEQLQAQSDNHVEKHVMLAPSPPKPATTQGKENWDSGYHGITDDEMELEHRQGSRVMIQSPQKIIEEAVGDGPVVLEPAAERRATDETFVSAKEDQASRNASSEALREAAESLSRNDETVQIREVLISADDADHRQSSRTAKTVDLTAEEETESMDVDDVRSPSETSSPAKPLLRKSSFTFSSLPSREPLAQKKSIGARSSVLPQARPSVIGHFTGGKSLGGHHNFGPEEAIDDSIDGEMPTVSAKPILGRAESQTTKNHNHSTTQRLQDRINMLGQAREMRTSKSIPNLNASAAQALYPQLPQTHSERPDGGEARLTTVPSPRAKALPMAAEERMDEDDWIAPVAPVQGSPRLALTRIKTAESVDSIAATEALNPQKESPRRRFSPSRPKLPFGPKKAVSSSNLASPTKSSSAFEPSLQKPISVSNPTMQTGNESTTPVGSPRRGHLDGAVSATKAKLYSALRSAKGIFASSAGVSAQAKMEALSPAPKARQPTTAEGYFPDMNGAIPYPDLPQSRIASAETAVSTTTLSTEGRKTRSSSEREHSNKGREDQEHHQQRKFDDPLDKAREKERQKAAAAALKPQKSPSKEHMRHAPISRTDFEGYADVADAGTVDDMPPPPPPKSMLPTTQAQRLRGPGRIAKPTKEAPRTRPAPVAVRMPSQRIGHHANSSTTTLSQSLHDTLPPAPPPKPALISKASTTSLHSSTANSTLRGQNPSQAARKALDAAAKKKEAELKAAQRKAEQKREIELRKAAKLEDERRRQEEERQRQEEEKRHAEEERRAEQQRRANEQQRREEARRAAQKQAAEAKRLEQERLDQHRLEQQRMEQERREQQRAQQEGFAYALKHERAQNIPAMQTRADLGGARPMSRMMQHDGRPPVQVNPAKPPKRALQQDDDEQQHYQRPAVQRNPPSYQQSDAKRRKTEDEEDELNEPRRSVMAGPPVRQSNIRKPENKFLHGYATAPAPPPHNPSMYIKTVTSQHQGQHAARPIDMAKFANGRIPFADAPNPPGPSVANPYKTPGRPIAVPLNGKSTIKSTVKSSPHYPNPESIDLPEIATDSEDEDSENEFQAPGWTDSPALRELLTQQQLVDPQSVFGPIAPLRMEEVFKNKDRQKKFRDRTSSANWNGADRLTEEERQRDREARERMMKDGGWSFQPGP